MYLVDQSFLIAGHQLKMYQGFFTITLIQSCKVAGDVSRILVIFKKIKNVGNTPENAILVTADVVGLYPNIPHNAGLKALSNMLEVREYKAVYTEDLVKIIRFVLENNYFEFNGDVKK